MKELSSRIKTHFDNSINLKKAMSSKLSPIIAKACNQLTATINNGNKILCCGNGGSAADAQHFSAELVNRFEIERPGLPAISLTTDSSTLTSIANDYAYEKIFSRQISAIGNIGDTLLAISTSGNSINILKAIETAKNKDMNIIALTGNDGGKITNILSKNDTEIRVESQQTARIQEVHILIIHCLCDGIDLMLFGDKH